MISNRNKHSRAPPRSKSGSSLRGGGVNPYSNHPASNSQHSGTTCRFWFLLTVSLVGLQLWMGSQWTFSQKNAVNEMDQQLNKISPPPPVSSFNQLPPPSQRKHQQNTNPLLSSLAESKSIKQREQEEQKNSQLPGGENRVVIPPTETSEDTRQEKKRQADSFESLPEEFPPVHQEDPSKDTSPPSRAPITQSDGDVEATPLDENVSEKEHTSPPSASPVAPNDIAMDAASLNEDAPIPEDERVSRPAASSSITSGEGSMFDILQSERQQMLQSSSLASAPTEIGPIGSIFATLQAKEFLPFDQRTDDRPFWLKKKDKKFMAKIKQDRQNAKKADVDAWIETVMKRNASNVPIPSDYSLTAPMTSTTAWSNETTLAFYRDGFNSGYRNQIMCITILMLHSGVSGHKQVLLDSIPGKDTYGSNKMIPFSDLWDVPFWNSHYPQLPRLVVHDPVLHSQYNASNLRWHRTEDKLFGTDGVFVSEKPQRPFAYGQAQNKLFGAYMRYSNGKTKKYNIDGHRHPMEILMLKGAMRPHPDMRAIVEAKKQALVVHEVDQDAAPVEYMTLHARVEPDMQAHPVCPGKKVLNLTDIFEFIETKWTDPPVSRIFMPINRQYMEKVAIVDKEKKLKAGKEVNWIAVENLKALNRARDEGLWGGRVKVFEFGANALNGTVYEKTPSTPGAMLNFFIAIDAKIFIGTEVSSYSHDILATRFYRDKMENYKYLPDGLHDWTPPGMVDSPGFDC